MKCNRTACTNNHQYWWNRYTEAYYCQPCALRINESSVQSALGEIVVKHLFVEVHVGHAVGQYELGDEVPEDEVEYHGYVVPVTRKELAEYRALEAAKNKYYEMGAELRERLRSGPKTERKERP